MVIACIAGGLGNQMFQYAMARRLALHRRVELKLDVSNYRDGCYRRPRGLEKFQRKYGLNEFSIAASEAGDKDLESLRDRFSRKSISASVVWRVRRCMPNLFWPTTHVREKHYHFDPAGLELPAHVYVQGLWQTEKYFADVAPAIRSELSPKDPIVTQYARDYVKELRGLGGPIVSVHVRRGDDAYAYERLRRPELVTNPGGTSLEYLVAAMRRFGPDSKFLVFSDTREDIAWCKHNMPVGLLHFSEGHSDIQDLAIMSSCDHNIIANSTFSWWAAWLNSKPGRRVLAPKRWPPPMVPDDLIPSDWEMI